MFQALCILANVADGDTAKDFIMMNEDVLKKIMNYMVSQPIFNNPSFGIKLSAKKKILTNWSTFRHTTENEDMVSDCKIHCAEHVIASTSALHIDTLVLIPG